METSPDATAGLDADQQPSPVDGLPDVILEQMFALLSVEELLLARLVCRRWRRLGHVRGKASVPGLRAVRVLHRGLPPARGQAAIPSRRLLLPRRGGRLPLIRGAQQGPALDAVVACALLPPRKERHSCQLTLASLLWQHRFQRVDLMLLFYDSHLSHANQKVFKTHCRVCFSILLNLKSMLATLATLTNFNRALTFFFGHCMLRVMM